MADDDDRYPESVRHLPTKTFRVVVTYKVVGRGGATAESVRQQAEADGRGPSGNAFWREEDRQATAYEVTEGGPTGVVLLGSPEEVEQLQEAIRAMSDAKARGAELKLCCMSPELLAALVRLRSVVAATDIPGDLDMVRHGFKKLIEELRRLAWSERADVHAALLDVLNASVAP